MSVDVDDIKSWIASSTGSVPAADPDAEDVLRKVIAAVEAHFVQMMDVPDPIDGEMPADWNLAVVMQSSRLWSRRNSPTGVAGLNDFGVVRVSSIDHDVRQLLAPYRPGPIA